MNLPSTFRIQNIPVHFLIALLYATTVLFGTEAFAEITFLNTWGTLGSGDGQFNNPIGLSIANTGEVYVADNTNHRIQWFNEKGEYLGQYGNFGSGNGQFMYPWDVAVSAAGQVFVADRNNNRIQKFDEIGGYLGQWSTAGNPEGVAVSLQGHIFVSAALSSQIERFNSNGDLLLQWGGYGSGDGQFYSPLGISVDENDHVYVVDEQLHRVQRFDAAGAYQTQWGGQGSSAGQFEYPRGVVVSASGHVYIADQENDRIQRFDIDGNYQTEWGSLGSSDGQFNAPAGVAVSPTGQIYVTDKINNRIQRFFDSEAWASGTNTFTDGINGPISVEVGVGEILGTSLTLDASKGLEVGDVTTIQSDGTLTLDGGWLSTASLVNNGSFEFSSGQLAITSSSVSVDTSGLLGKNVEIDGSKDFEPYILEVGSVSGGSIAVTDGGSVTTVLNTTIAGIAGENGSAHVSGFGSSLTVGNYLDVGLYGNAALYITDGATVSTLQATIAAFSGAGNVTVSGAGFAMGCGSIIPYSRRSIWWTRRHWYFKC